MRFPLILATLTLLASTVAFAQDAGEPRKPNVIYILADDLGYAEVGAYGQTKIKTPNIDRIAREGMSFTQHYSGSAVCAPSRCVLLTGMHTGHSIVRSNWENGGWGEHEPEGQFPLPTGTQTISSLLSGAGYATACVGKWGLGGPATVGAPNEHGFDLFYGYLCQRKAHNYYPTHLWKNGKKDPLEGNDWFAAHQKLKEPLAEPDGYEKAYQRKTYAVDRMLEETLTFMRESKDEPFFLYFASPIPHVALQIPYEELNAYPAEWDEAPYLGNKGYTPHPRPRAAYAAMVSRLDSDVGAILDLLDEMGVADNTLVMFSSDNGPTYAGGADSKFFESAGPFRGLKGSTYEGGIRVPMIARWPGHIEPGAVTEHMSAFQDVLPTVAEAAGLEHAAVDGRSFLPALEGKQQDAHDYLYWEYNGQQALRTARWKAVRPRLKKGETKLQLFDLMADIAESKNVADEHPEVVKELEALMAAAHTPSKDFPLPTIDE